mgnify:FL=1
MKMPLVSVVMPTFNSGSFVREAIHSLIHQNYPRHELIVVDGGSTDQTLPIVRSYMGDGDLKLIELPPGLGIPKALNAGIAAAAGEFIARMDADDVAYYNRLSEQVTFLSNLPEVTVVGSGVDRFFEDSGSSRSPQWHDHIIDNYLINNPFFHPTIMIHRSIVDSGLFRYDEDQPCDEDYELWGRLLLKTKAANIDSSLLRYRVHGQNAQWDPRKHRYKAKALRGFCEPLGIADPALIDALVEFQCGNFVRHHTYEVLHAYARRAENEGLPRLGWIHHALLREPDYARFVIWFRKAKGWPA